MSGRALAGSVITATVAATVLGGCFTTTADYRSEAEAFIVEEVTIADEDVTFTAATCDEPDGQEPGTSFDCTATDQSGAVWGFEVTIEADNRFVVSVTERP
ncbi:MAG TPA: hypothetical protein VK860_06825 [Ilumatobacteraceae bacterium]|jgi:hypothetical protein|nr:hypothetical protein [Ilumatobacteraceae bacterium]